MYSRHQITTYPFLYFYTVTDCGSSKLSTALINKKKKISTNTHTHIHTEWRKSPSLLFKIDISHIRFYHAVTFTRFRYPLKNLALSRISSSIGNLKGGGKSREKEEKKFQVVSKGRGSGGGARESSINYGDSANRATHDVLRGRGKLVASRMNYASPRFDVERRRFCVDIR